MQSQTHQPFVERNICEEILEEIAVSRHIPVIVEGPSDKYALEKLGFTNVIFLRKALPIAAEEVAQYKEMILLTDLDNHGRELYKRLYCELNARGVLINNTLRKMIRQTGILQIEALANHIRKKHILVHVFVRPARDFVMV